MDSQVSVSPTLLRILRSTVLEMERTLELPANDTCLRDLKQAVVLALGELERKRAASRMKILWIEPDLACKGRMEE